MHDMTKNATATVIDFQTQDIYGESFRLEDLRGRRVMLSFFRDAACPFCNLRVYELTNRYTEWKAAGLTVVTVFSSPADQVRAFVARRPRPFFMISDPELEIYRQYGVQQSTAALFKALLFKMHRIVGGVATGGRPKPNPDVRLVPAGFLVDEDGNITDSWYRRETSDHIPLERVQAFAEEGRQRREDALLADSRALEEARRALTESKGRIEALGNDYRALEKRMTELQLKNQTLEKILEAYKRGAGYPGSTAAVQQMDSGTG
jgi:peroxiredoxin